MLGFQYFSSLTEIRDREFVKGGSIVLTFTVDGRLTTGLLWSPVLPAFLMKHLLPLPRSHTLSEW